ncbi:cytochrome-c peroxidase [Methylomonas methanica]|uniref:Di-heme cytochrome c peroxidase n=1 Tax=Methylomonas methanica (strain DSM 25384 / MC09) TaxID=857087 RepID=F9ZZ64_METMM|nr:cytochrome c peroxidase [Methylomonas methanica]AEG01090.1 Di-heme cytochrome c peroxidase [Methylomonas methanica MC09]
MKLSVILLSACCAVVSQLGYAHGPLPVPLIGVPVPPVPGLTDGQDPIIVNKDMAIALGKALFWDVNVGSDGMACASCHFHAGADNRVKNQINPGTLNPHPDNLFDTLPSGNGGPNHTLTAADFPLVRYADPLNKDSGRIFETDDAVASSGTFSGEFTGVSQFTGSNDNCQRSADSVFNVNGIGTRRVEPRNAPSVINAVFNHRSFWDGRGNNVFNGSNNWGDRDPNAGVWVQVNRRTVRKQALHLENSALASQAVATAMSQLEMTCANRSIADIGRKLLLRKPLQYQKVHYTDSVFGTLNLTNSAEGNLQPGLKTTYKDMVRTAFASKFWSNTTRGAFGSPAAGGLAYTQMEANFPMFFGLAIQMYESTLISDQAPIDTAVRDPDTYKPVSLTDSERRGMEVFTESHCNLCHAGPVMTTNAIVSNSLLVTPTPNAFFGPQHSLRAFGPEAMGKNFIDMAKDAGITDTPNVVMRDVTRNPKGQKLIDFGFFNTGVNDPDADPGLGGVDEFGKPLSYSAQYVQYLMGNDSEVKDQAVKHIHSCQFLSPLAWDLGSDIYFSAFFTLSAEREPDGSREGAAEIALRSQNCQDPDYAYIPTVDAAIAAFNNPDDRRFLIGSKAAFKIPSLRNIELTGPYMHNGSMATLEQVIEFYARGGNFDNSNQSDFLTRTPMSDNAQKRADLLAFLKTLTDDRVRYEQAPFDHPELIVPNGHDGDDQFVQAGHALSAQLAKEAVVVLPAVGASGRAAPIEPFLAP